MKVTENGMISSFTVELDGELVASISMVENFEDLRTTCWLDGTSLMITRDDGLLIKRIEAGVVKVTEYTDIMGDGRCIIGGVVLHLRVGHGFHL